MHAGLLFHIGEMDVITQLTAVLVTLCIIIYTYFHFGYKYWEKRKFPFLPPKFPLGNTTNLIRTTRNFNLETDEFYNKIKRNGWKFGGVYMFMRPVLVVIDPDYISEILSKDFKYFSSRGNYYNKKADPLSAHLGAVEGVEWKNLRSNLSPMFSSSKMKMMYSNLLEHSNRMVVYIGKLTEAREDINIQQVMIRYTVDVIMSSAFGLESNSYESEKYIELAKKFVTARDWKHILSLIITACSPEFAKVLEIKVVRSDVSEICTKMVTETVRYREENNLRRPDFLQLIVDMKNENKLTQNDMIAQAIVFFRGSFDTSSITLTTILYELCRNPKIQEKTRLHINEVLNNHGRKLTFDSLKDMTYLQQVIDETLRLYPPALNLQRMSVKDYKLRDTDLVIEAGTQIVIPIYSLQRDPDYYPNPELFDPERFSAENKSERHSYLHLPFGEGPRNCIGSRFALIQVKVGLCDLLRNFKFTISPSTQLPLTINQRSQLLRINETLYLNAEKIE